MKSECITLTTVYGYLGQDKDCELVMFHQTMPGTYLVTQHLFTRGIGFSSVRSLPGIEYAHIVKFSQKLPVLLTVGC